MSFIGQERAAVEQMPALLSIHPIRKVLTTALIDDWCVRAQHSWRDRIFTPVVTLLSCMVKQLQGSSARQIEQLNALFETKTLQCDGSDFCQARRRLPLSIFQHAVGHLAGHVEKSSGYGLRIVYVDGTTTPLPRTPENAAVFGFAPNQRGRSVLPVARMLLLISAATGAVCDAVCAPFRMGELRLFRVLLLRLDRPSLLIGDALFSAYWVLALARHKGHHVISPPQPHRLNRLVCKLGSGDELHQWEKPPKAPLEFPAHLWRLVPQQQSVRVIRRTLARRGYRDLKLVLCTTLLDVQTYSADEIVGLYLKRWNVECDIRTLKMHHGLARLTTRKPANVLREFFSILLAYNTVRCLMANSGDARSLSHRQCVALIVHVSAAMAFAPPHQLSRLYDQLLDALGLSKLKTRPRGPEPRALIHRGKPYPIFRSSRAEWRAKRQAG